MNSLLDLILLTTQLNTYVLLAPRLGCDANRGIDSIVVVPVVLLRS